MRDLAVVALEEVLADDLPIRLDHGLPAGVVDEGVHVEPELGDLRGERAERLRQRLGVDAGVREDERAPGADRDRNEAELVLREVRLLLAARRLAEAAVEPVRPGVVRALQRLAVRLPLGEREAAVAADVDEATQHAVAVLRDDDRCAAYMRGEVARRRELSGVADVLPHRPEDSLLLPPQDLGIRVPGVRQRRLHGASVLGLSNETMLRCARWCFTRPGSRCGSRRFRCRSPSRVRCGCACRPAVSVAPISTWSTASCHSRRSRSFPGTRSSAAPTTGAASVCHGSAGPTGRAATASPGARTSASRLASRGTTSTAATRSGSSPTSATACRCRTPTTTCRWRRSSARG